MSGIQANHDQPEPVRPTAPPRVVADWEYQTAYVPQFQVRLSVELHERLCEWARQEHKSLGDLLVETLEEAIRQRG